MFAAKGKRLLDCRSGIGAAAVEADFGGRHLQSVFEHQTAAACRKAACHAQMQTGAALVAVFGKQARQADACQCLAPEQAGFSGKRNGAARFAPRSGGIAAGIGQPGAQVVQ